MNVQSKIGEWCDSAITSADQADQLATVAHLVLVLFQNCSHPEIHQVQGAKAELMRFMPRLNKNRHQQQSHHPLLTAPDRIAAHIDSIAAKPFELDSELADLVLNQLLDGTCGLKDLDQTQPFVRDLCDQVGLTSNFFGGSKFDDAAIAELGFGRWLGQQESLKALIGREPHIRVHAPLLEQALNRRSVYLLTGESGVGKSHFVRQLIKSCQQRGNIASLFAFFSPSEFLAARKSLSQMLSRLFAFLVERTTIVPVFDDFDRLVADPNCLKAFDEVLGPVFRYNERAAVFVCRSDHIGRVRALSDIRPRKLRSLEPEFTSQLVAQRLKKKLKSSRAFLAADDKSMAFAASVVKIAAERYGAKCFPQTALDLLDGALLHGSAESAVDGKPWQLRQQHIWDFVAVDLGLNPELLGANQKTFFQNLSERLKERVFGQEHVVDQVVQELYAKSLVPPKEKPRGRFLFAGPPGTGKTQLCKALAEEMGYGADAFYQFNMGEFSGEDAKNRFIGANPGYKQSMETFTVFNAVRETPACVILLDEVDRAHGSIQDILLGFLEGRGRDAEGRSHRFDQAIFVMTTNQGQEQIEQALATAMKGQDNPVQAREKFAKSIFATESLGIQAAAKSPSLDLRKLLLSRAGSANESLILDFVKSQLQEISAAFSTAMSGGAPGDGQTLKLTALADRYGHLVQTQKLIRYDNAKAMLDRALLDRIDFICPFFPLGEEHISKILDAELAEQGWSECDAGTRQKILQAALNEQERGRAVARLVEQYKQTSKQFNLWSN